MPLEDILLSANEDAGMQRDMKDSRKNKFCAYDGAGLEDKDNRLECPVCKTRYI